ncbi:MAG: chemotaxis protein CheA [Thermodesulfobacteriota bacterium]
MSEIELDPELLADFIVESRELLEEFSANVIELENKPHDQGTIGAIFRAAHTLKGSSAFFNLTHIKNFAHKLENLLDQVRNKVRTVGPEVINYLLAGGNHLKDMFERVAGGDYQAELTAAEERFLHDLLAFSEAKPAEVPHSPEETITAIRGLTVSFLRQGRDPAEVIREIDHLAARFAPTESAPVPAPAAPAGPAAGTGWGFRGVDLTGPVVRARQTMEQAVAGGDFDSATYDEALTELKDLVDAAGLDPLEEPLGEAIEDFRAVRDSAMDFDPLLLSLLKEKLEAFVARLEPVTAPPPPAPAAPQTLAETGPVAGKPVVEKPGPEPEKKPREEKLERKTMRIDEEKVDGFMNYVGELIVTSETFNYLQKMIEHEKVNPRTVRAFKNANQAFRELSGELQESLMEIRRVPVKGLLQKVNMMSRELSNQMKKKVRVELEGQEVQVDKSIAESLEGPLVHVTRNSLDHGLETPEERERAGKSAEGLLRVMATTDKEYFHLEVKDDGRGIDPARMRRAAVEKGLLGPAQAEALTDREAVNLVFAPGFSTAREVTDVSGRGVGMDVVRTNISRLNGTITLDSQPGLGTTIGLKIPLSVTLQVIKALLVRVGRDNFIISLEDILETLRPSASELSTVEGRGEIFNRRGQILPLIRLYQVFGLTPQFTDPAEAILVVVETARGRFGLMVDEVLGQQQVVVKELGAQFKKLTFISGSATLGDGRLGLVLDAEGVVRLAQDGS